MPRTKGPRSNRARDAEHDAQHPNPNGQEVNPTEAAGPAAPAGTPTPPKLVVVGASAGGIQALTTLVSSLAPNFPAPIVFAQHLDPHRHSSLPEILSRRTLLPVITIDGPTPLLPGHIYVVPPNRNIVINDGHVDLQQDLSPRPRPSVDVLLISAAKVYGERLIAAILTGTGVDGAAGAVEVKRAGGTIIIQNPRTARYPSMPLALPPTVVDHIVDLENLASLLTGLVGETDLAPALAEPSSGLQTIFATVNRHANIDFQQYKPTTILRRISRRMAATHNLTIEAYADYLQRNPAEVVELVKAFLIKVTDFFRDPDAFHYLRDNVLPELLEEARARGNVLRLWSAGCATGEEPYSLALLLADMLGPDLSQWSIKIFATDLDEHAIEFARRGLYTENVLTNLPPDFRDTYFERVDSGYRLAKSLRQMVIFGQQDLTRGVPFPRIDLVVCRNLLIYFKPDLQQQVLDKFTFSLHQTHGFLFLGQAETVRPSQNNFNLVNKKWKIYRCLRPPHFLAANKLDPAPAPHSTDDQLVAGRSVGYLQRPMTNPEIATYDSELRNLRHFNDTVLRLLPTGVAVVDRAYRIVTINTSARRLLGIREIAAEQDFLHSARGLPYSQVRAAIDSAFRERSPVSLQELGMEEVSGGKHYISLTVMPVDTEPGAIDVVIINVQDATDVVETDFISQVVEAEQKQLLVELQATNRRLSDMNKEFQDSNEELQAANEELMLAQEELQATNEEFEATNEELQATNEELETNNEELQATNEELETTNEELSARTTELVELSRTLSNERVHLSEIVELAPYYVMVLRGPRLTLESLNPRYGEIFATDKALGLPIDEVLTGEEMAPLLERIWTSYRLNTTQTTAKLRAYLPTVKDDDTQIQPPAQSSVVQDEGRDPQYSSEPERFMSYTIVPIHDKDNHVDGLAVYAEDVTEQVAREAFDRLQRLRLIVEHADQVALGLFDAGTTELIYASPRYRDHLAQTQGLREAPDQIIGYKWLEVAPIGDGSDPAGLFRATVETHEPQRLNEVRHAFPDGTQTIWDYSLTPIFDGANGSNDKGYVVVSAIETTDQVRVRQELEHLDEMKDLFLSSASHELRTPLVPLVGYADMLSRLVERHKNDEGWDSRITDYVGRFVRPLRHLRRLVDDLFDVARLENGKLTVEKNPTDLKAVIELVIEEARMFSEAHKIEVEVPKSGSLTVMGDEARLVQVVTNLLHNAIKFSPEPKPIHLRLRRETRSGAKLAVIEVQDGGEGIPPEDLPNIFSRFYQSRHLPLSQAGLGLGLFIARSIIEQHGGTIAAISTPGEGSTFTVILPLMTDRK